MAAHETAMVNNTFLLSILGILAILQFEKSMVF